MMIIWSARKIVVLIIFAGIIAFLAGCRSEHPAPSPTVIASTTLAPFATQTSTLTPAPEATATHTPPPPSTFTPSAIPSDTWNPTEVSSEVSWLVDWPVSVVDVPAFSPFFSPWEDEDSWSYFQDGQTWLVVMTGGVAGGAVAQVEPTPLFENRFRTAPGGSHAIECRPESAAIFRLPERTLVAEAMLQPAFGCFADWLADGSAVAFVATGGDVYLWAIDQPAPVLLGNTAGALLVSWSPDQTKLLVYGTEYSFEVYYRDGQPKLAAIEEIAVGRDQEWPWLSWVGDDAILDLVLSSTTICVLETIYYSTAGEALVSNLNCDRSKQNSVISPDHRWLALDQSTPLAAERESNRYTIYDFDNRKESVLLETNSHHLDLLGWTEGVPRLLAVLRPISEESRSVSGQQGGLVIIDPMALSIETLVPGIMYALPDPGFRSLLTFAHGRDGSVHAGVYTVSGERVLDLGPVSDRVRFQSPANDFPFDARWDHAGNRVLLAAGGALLLGDLENGLLRLAGNFPTCEVGDESDCARPLFYWSPDDRYVLIQAGDRTWVLAIP